MTLVYAIHTIHHVVGGKQAAQKAGGVFNLANEKDVVDMKRLGAVRDPTEQEVQLHQMATGQLVPAGSKAAKTPVVETPVETPAPVVAPIDGVG